MIRSIGGDDGDGLYLVVSPKGTKWWRFDYRFDGKQQTLSLGVYGSEESQVGLSQARDSAIDMRPARQAGNQSLRQAQD